MGMLCQTVAGNDHQKIYIGEKTWGCLVSEKLEIQELVGWSDLSWCSLQNWYEQKVIQEPSYVGLLDWCTLGIEFWWTREYWNVAHINKVLPFTTLLFVSSDRENNLNCKYVKYLMHEKRYEDIYVLLIVFLHIRFYKNKKKRLMLNLVVIRS